MKLGIVIPLKAKSVSRNWSTTCALLEQTLNCVEAQTSKSFVSIVVGHDEPPCFRKYTYKTTFHQLEVPPPDPSQGPVSHFDYVEDKQRKVLRGMQLLQDQGIDYWYRLDADDLIHREFVEFLGKKDCRLGGIFKGGYMVYLSQNRYVSVSDLWLHCGSCTLLSNQLCDIREGLDFDSIKSVPWCHRSHRNMDKYFEEQAPRNYVEIHEKLIGYSLNHGDNLSDFWRPKRIQRLKAWLKPYMLGKPLNADFKNAFSL